MPEEKESVDCAVTVVVRSRPINDRERKATGAGTTGVCLEFFGGHTVKLTHPKEAGKVHTFTFDHAYNSTVPGSEDFVPQERIFNDMGKRVLNASLEGFNTCIFAYGQTGSGKTYTMMGPGGGRESKQDPGLIPRICTSLFERCAAMVEDNRVCKMTELDLAPPTLEFKIEVTYLEIYNERVRCLLNPKKENLKVRQHPVTGVYVEDLTKMLVSNSEEVLDLMNEGNNARTVAATNMNDRSSRSHAIFSLIVTQTRTITTKIGVTSSDRVSRINLVDLAGSERAKSTGAEGDRLKEGAGINQSLTTLGLVISGLAESSKQRVGGPDAVDKKVFIPYRDSTLTWLLKENLGGNSKTFMMSALSPADINYDETLGTLRYADRAKSIVTRACVNEDPNAKMIRDLRSEIENYKQRLFQAEEEVQKHKREAEEIKERIQTKAPSRRMASISPQGGIVSLPPRKASFSESDGDDAEGSPDVPFRIFQPPQVAVKSETIKMPFVPKLALGGMGGSNISPASASPVRNVVGANYTPDDAITAILTARGGGQESSFYNDDDDPMMLTLRDGQVGKESETVAALQRRLAMTEKIMHDMNQSWEEKKRKTEVEAEARVDSMATLNIAVKANKKLPYLMNLNQGDDDDCDWIVHYLCVGNTYVGTEVRADGVTILGDGIAANHCILCHKEGQGVLLHPIGGAETAIDTAEVTEPTYLSSGCVISIGTKILKFVDPSIPNTARGRTMSAIGDKHKRAALRNRTIDLMEGRVPERDVVVTPPFLTVPISVNTNTPMMPSPVGRDRAATSMPMTATTDRRGFATPPASPAAVVAPPKRMILTQRAQDESVMVLKYNVVFLGPRSSGKSTLRQTLFTEEKRMKWFWEDHKCPTVTSTVSVDVTKETVTVGTDRVEFILTDLSGCEDLMSTHSFCVPDSRVIFVLTFNLLNSMDIPTLKPWIELLQARCPGIAVFLVGTHKDECRDADLILQTLNGAECAVIDYCGIIQKDEALRLQVVGTAAVSNKDRSVVIPTPGGRRSNSMTMRDLLQILSRHALEKWKADTEYPGGFVPARILTLQRKVAEIRAQGSWSVSGMEFKHTASLIDSRYTYDTEELAQHSNLLHSWRSLIHFRFNALLQRHVFFDAELVMRMVSHLYSVIFNFNAVVALYPLILSPRDRDELSKGVLSVANAAVIFRPFLTALRKVDKDVKICLEIISMFDIVFPIPTPSGGVLPSTPIMLRRLSASATTTNTSRAPQSKIHVQSAAQSQPVVEYFLIPEVFPGTIPNCVPNSFADLMHGLHKKYTFNVLPGGLFARLLARLSRSISRIFHGAITDLNHCDGQHNTFWRNAAWLQDRKPSRGLLRTDRKSIFISLNSITDDPLHPSFQMLGSVDNSLKMIAAEYRGVYVEEFVRCINRECRHWLLLGKDLHVGTDSEIVFCPGCKKAFSHGDVVSNRYESRAAMLESKRSALLKVAANLTVDLTVEARKELRMIADEYYAKGGQEEDQEEEVSPRQAPTEEEDVSVLDRVLEVMMNCSVAANCSLSPRLGYREGS